MRQTAPYLIALVALAACSANATSNCTEREAYAAEVATDYLNSWENVHRFFLQFGRCYDASIAEGMDDKIHQLWSKHWKSLPQMIALTNKDARFKAFLWERISDETFSQEQFAVVVGNAKTKCPAVAKEFCRAVIKNAAQPINPPDAAR